MSFNKGMSCEEITRQCATSRAFAQVCREEAFWNWQCQLRDYDRPGRLDPASGGPRGGTWRTHYKWWCARQHTNSTLKPAVEREDSMFMWELENVQYEGAAPYDNPPEGVVPYDHPFYGPIAEWDVSSVTDMTRLFGGIEYFNGDLSRWDVSNVTNMSGMFQSRGYLANDTTDFNGDLSRWDVSKVTNMNYMFSGAGSFTGDLSGWDVSNVTDMNSMFRNARTFNGDLSRWVVSSVTDMAFMFENARTFNGDLSRWVVSNVTNMHAMFENASSFNRAGISGWNVSKVTNMSSIYGTVPPVYSLVLGIGPTLDEIPSSDDEGID